MSELTGLANYEVKRESRLSVFLKQLMHNKMAFLSLIFLLIVHIVVFLGPLFCKVSPEAIDPANQLTAWSLEHPLGTDNLGRDVFSRMISGGQVTLLVGFGAMIF